MSFEEEKKVFAANIDKWRETNLRDSVLIKGSDVIGIYPTLGEAFDEGLKRFGMDDFFVDQIKMVNVVCCQETEPSEQRRGE